MKDFWLSYRVLIKKEWFLERKDKSLIGQTLLFELAGIFTIYLLQKSIDDERLLTVFIWLIVLFSAFQLASKNFAKDNRYTLQFIRQYCGAESYIFSKITFNYALLLVAMIIGVLIFSLLFSWDWSSMNLVLFFGAIGLGSFSLSAVLTFVSSIAYKAGNSAGLTATLGFPLILPGLMFSTRLLWYGLRGIETEVAGKYLLALLALNVLILGLVKILFPYLWRD